MVACATSREFLQQPRQGHFQPHMILGDVDGAGRRLPERAHPEGQPVAGPDFLVHLQHRKGLGGAGQPGLQAAQRLLFAERMRDGNDDRLRHGADVSSLAHGRNALPATHVGIQPSFGQCCGRSGLGPNLVAALVEQLERDGENLRDQRHSAARNPLLSNPGRHGFAGKACALSLGSCSIHPSCEFQPVICRVISISDHASMTDALDPQGETLVARIVDRPRDRASHRRPAGRGTRSRHLRGLDLRSRATGWIAEAVFTDAEPPGARSKRLMRRVAGPAAADELTFSSIAERDWVASKPRRTGAGLRRALRHPWRA